MKSPYPGRRFSWARLCIGVCVLALVIALAGAGRWYAQRATRQAPATWFGGYVDVTATPSYQFQATTGAGQNNVVLSFVVAKDGSCTPSWGGYYGLDEAAGSLDLDRRIAELAQSSRTAVISFGGRDGTELARACTGVDQLAAAYEAVVDRYGATVLDFDLEGAALSDASARQRRVQALEELRAAEQKKGRSPAIWLTLPADAHGLTGDGLTAVTQLLSAGLGPVGVNLMTMDFGVDSAKQASSSLVTASLNAAHEQLFRSYAMAGDFYTSSQIWSLMGATVMIGQNDTAGEVFTTGDAAAVQRFAAAQGLGRISMWSMNRDQQCSGNQPDWTKVSTSCSGVQQDDRAFSTALSTGRSGAAGTAFTTPGSTPVASGGVSPTTSASDDPSTSPYPIWSATRSYAAGDKVVWERQVYVATWTTRGDQPDQASSADGGESPWRIVGPVLPGETPSPTPTLPAGFYPQWSKSAVYQQGARVLFEGVAYEAKWWTQGDSPDRSEVDESSPWQALSSAEVQKLLGGG